MSNDRTQVEEAKSDTASRKPYARPALIKHGTVAEQTMLTQINPSQPIP